MKVDQSELNPEPPVEPKLDPGLKETLKQMAELMPEEAATLREYLLAQQAALAQGEEALRAAQQHVLKLGKALFKGRPFDSSTLPEAISEMVAQNEALTREQEAVKEALDKAGAPYTLKAQGLAHRVTELAAQRDEQRAAYLELREAAAPFAKQPAPSGWKRLLPDVAPWLCLVALGHLRTLRLVFSAKVPPAPLEQPVLYMLQAQEGETLMDAARRNLLEKRALHERLQALAVMAGGHGAKNPEAAVDALTMAHLNLLADLEPLVRAAPADSPAWNQLRATMRQGYELTSLPRLLEPLANALVPGQKLPPKVLITRAVALAKAYAELRIAVRPWVGIAREILGDSPNRHPRTEVSHTLRIPLHVCQVLKSAAALKLETVETESLFRLLDEERASAWREETPRTGTLHEVLEALEPTLRKLSLDWTASADHAWLYGILVGWNEQALTELRDKFRWDATVVARLRRLHAAVRLATTNPPPAKGRKS